MKLTQFVTPTGQKGDITKPSSWLPLVLGAGVFFLALDMGQTLGRKAKRLPGGFDGQLDPLTGSRAQASPPRPTYGI